MDEAAAASDISAERAQRPLAVGRKNFYGSGAEWSGDGRLLAALGFGASAWHLKPHTS